MAQSSRGYNTMRSFPSQAPFANQPYPPFAIPSHPAHPSQPSSSSIRPGIPNGEDARDPYKHNRNVIPGLALGFPTIPVDWASQRAGSFSQHAPVPSHAGASATMAPLMSNMGTSVARHTPTQEGKDEFTSDSTIEDGEVCEDDLGDERDLSQAQRTVVPTHEAHGRKPGEPSNVIHVIHAKARERSGSYSPHLSPPELDRQRDSTHPAGINGKLAGQHATRTAPQRVIQPEVAIAMPISDFLRVRTVVEARKQARDAILRLWPLNVRYQNYLDEGIDESLLKSLFQELGFDAGSKVNVEKLHGEKTERPDVSVQERSRPTTAPGSNEEPAKPMTQDKSEERKDRIARLLAAKNPKPGSSTSQTVAQTQPSQIHQSPQASPIQSHQAPADAAKGITKASAQSSSLSQTEKSKLLYQKMEALKKARETRGQKRPYQDQADPFMTASASKAVADTTPSVPTTSAAAPDANIIKHPGGPSLPIQHKSASNPSAIDQPAQAIPGSLTLSTPQLPPVRESTSGHSSVPVGMEPDDRPFKRPFGQARGSRPFLIDVSDDEDDAEMDIDSPDHVPSSILGSATPLFNGMSGKNGPLLADNGPIRQISSPLHTSSGLSSSDSSTKDDLENMKKKIEAMKQKIAEAEARKKAKHSHPQSPASTALDGQSQDDILAAGGGIIHPIVMPPPVLTTSVLRRSPSQPAAELSPSGLSHSSDTSRRRADSKRPSLSRAASERLPLIEAHRREQQLRLQVLQSQMAGIQREIQESLKEEERLRMDVSISTSDDEAEQTAPSKLRPSGQTGGVISSANRVVTDAGQAAAPNLLQPSEGTSLVDAVDSTSMSSASSNSMERSRNTTPVLAQEPSDQLMIDGKSASSFGHPKHELKVQTASEPKPVADVTDQPRATEETLETEHREPKTATLSNDVEDVVMQEESTDGEDMAEGSDSYEPPEVEPSSCSPSDQLRMQSPSSPLPAERPADETKKNDVSTDSSFTPSQGRQLAVVDPDATASESRREVDVSVWRDTIRTNLTPSQVETTMEAPASNGGNSQTGFSPYETPLSHFNAYRFHRNFLKNVPGGLRSLTYSNKVDVKKELCPDELCGRSCPRGKQCDYQHFETMQAPDDQILLQLGACSNLDEKRKQEYNSGLRQLLIDFRNNKVKDFHIISQSIVAYRARFYGDESKILPLGNVFI